MIVGRLAPSPTGALHVGNVRTFLWAWLDVRSRGGRLVLRIEDLEKHANATVLEEMLSDLKWLGFDWDDGPVWTDAEEQLLTEYLRFPRARAQAERRYTELKQQAPDEKTWNSLLGKQLRFVGSHPPYIQSLRTHSYNRIFENLRSRGLIYPCTCTRADYAASQSAPHEGDFEPCYPGTCRDRWPNIESARQFLQGQAVVPGMPVLSEPVWRFRVPEAQLLFEDRLFGPQAVNVAATVGDFVVFKSPIQPAYQLAVVADDIAMGVNAVVRGADLIPSTARQMLIYQALGKDLPVYGHVPLVLGEDGKRIAKRHGDSRIRFYRNAGLDPCHIIGVLARWSGLGDGRACSPSDLLSVFDWSVLSRERIVLDAGRAAELMKNKA